MNFANEERFDLNEKQLSNFLDKVSIDGDSGCWNWTGCLNRGKYGKFWYNGNAVRAHRVAYEHFREVKLELELDHLCENPKCVNPFHLEPVSRRENMVRSSRTVAGINARKTKCPRGHEYDMIVNSKNRAPSRSCSICRKIQNEKSLKKKKESK